MMNKKMLLLGAGLIAGVVFGEELVPMGTLDASFWRSVPMPDRGQFNAAPVVFPGSRQHMDFLQETDFPYQFEKYGDSPDKPYLFHADEVILVRFLGGWDEPMEKAEPFDLAYRDDDGVIQLRREMVKKRFSKYEESGAVDN